MPLNLVFSRAPHSFSKSSSRLRKGPITRGKAKKRMYEVLQEKGDKIVKWRRLSCQSESEKEVHPSKVVEIDTGDNSQTVGDVPIVGK